MKSSIARPATVAALTLALFAVLALSGCGGASSSATGDSSSTSADNSAQTQPAQTITEGQSLTINTADLSSKAQFYPLTVDGVSMEVLALKDSSGDVRTAYNTCQVCYSSGKGYYVQQGDKLVCQNCGNEFGVDQVEVESGGCNPVPIFDDQTKVSGSTIAIPYETLKEAEQTFANWKN